MEIRNKLVVAAIFFGLLFSLGVNKVSAHCGMCGMGEEKAAAQMASETEAFQATVVCLGCTLKKEQGAKAQCSIYGHKNALRTADGKIWTILENDTSAELINAHEYAGKKVEIKGNKLINAQVIEVENFKVVEE